MRSKTLTDLQKQALVYFVGGEQGEMPKNYLNNRHALQSKGLIEITPDEEGRRWAGAPLRLTDKGRVISDS